MVKVADLPSFDMAESLKTEEDIVMMCAEKTGGFNLVN